MRLTEVYIKGFKCFKDSGKIPMHSMTIFIGENDSGKTTLLQSLDILLNNRSVNKEEYHVDSENDTTSQEIEIIGIFDVSPEEIEGTRDLLLEEKLHLKKKISSENGIQYFVKKEAYTDDRLNSLERQLVPELKDILTSFGGAPSGLKANIITEIKSYIESNSQPKTIKDIPVQWKHISEIVPIFQRYTSSDYGNPHNLVAKVLTNVYRTYFYEKDDETKEEKLKGTYQTLKTEIESNLDDKIQESLKGVIKKYNSNVIEVKGKYNIDFAKGLNFYQLEIDTGSGLKPIANRGEGSKKRLYLAILEWDKEIESELPFARGIIKAYDEPDSNLHFGAQRRLFYTIQRDNKDDDNVQSIVATHSLTMIDRAPALTINCLSLNEFEQSKINFLDSDGDEEVREFLSQVSEIGGLKNSSIFYERCFLLVEGPSEENALPILYKKYYNRNLAEDGVVLVNLESNGAWKNFLKLLKKNKENCTLLFLDNDTQYSTSTAQVTPAKLTEIGFTPDFLTNNVVLVGTKEFEDTYENSILVRMLNAKFPKDDETLWEIAEIQAIRASTVKFSEDLRVAVSRDHRSRVGKPELALEFAKSITKEEIETLSEVKSLFEKISTIVR